MTTNLLIVCKVSNLLIAQHPSFDYSTMSHETSFSLTHVFTFIVPIKTYNEHNYTSYSL